MHDEIEVCPESELPPGKVVGAGRWAVGNSGGELFALSRRCRHLFADLGNGRIDRKDGCLVCPWHAAKYDIHSGRMERGPQAGFQRVPGLERGYKAFTTVVPLRRGTVEVRDGTIYVR